MFFFFKCKEDETCKEVDNDVKAETHKEQIKLIARQEHKCVAELAQAHNVVWGQCAGMSQSKTRVHEKCECSWNVPNSVQTGVCMIWCTHLSLSCARHRANDSVACARLWDSTRSQA